MKKPCRPRTEPEDEPFLGDDGDADAILIMCERTHKILDRYPRKFRGRPVGEFMTREDIEALTALNHIMTYLDNRAAYAKIADELRGYLVIE